MEFYSQTNTRSNDCRNNLRRLVVTTTTTTATPAIIPNHYTIPPSKSAAAAASSSNSRMISPVTSHFPLFTMDEKDYRESWLLNAFSDDNNDSKPMMHQDDDFPTTTTTATTTTTHDNSYSTHLSETTSSLMDEEDDEINNDDICELSETLLQQEIGSPRIKEDEDDLPDDDNGNGNDDDDDEEEEVEVSKVGATRCGTDPKTADGASSSSSSSTSLVGIPSKFDILCGQSRICASHTGNRRFQVLLDLYAPRYELISSKQEKMLLTKEIVASINQSGGRFLKYKDGYLASCCCCTNNCCC